MKTTNEYKPKLLTNRALVLACLSTVLGLAGCQQEGTAEKAGQKIDRAAENAVQKIDSAAENANQKIDAAKQSLDEKASKTEAYIEQSSEKAGKELENAKESVINKTETAGEYINDTVITLNVKSAIDNDALLKASHIEVTTEKGVVTLSGTVDSEPMIGRAVELATNQKDVKAVKTALVVNVTTPSKP